MHTDGSFVSLPNPPTTSKAKKQNTQKVRVASAKTRVCESFVDFKIKSYEYSFSDGEVDEPQEFLSDEDVP